MNGARLTALKVKALKPKAKRYMVADGHGLYLEVLPSGTKSWRVRYCRDGRPAKTNIGRWPAMSLEEARRHLRKSKPSLFSAIPGTTVRLFGARYMREIVQRDRKDPGDVQRYFDANIYPAIGDKEMEKVSIDDLRRIVFAKGEQGHHQAALALRDLLKRLFDYAVVCGILRSNPVHAIPRKYIATAKARSRSLVPAEVGQFVCALEKSRLRPTLKVALQLLLLTLVRKCELLQARWRDIDLINREWTIPSEHSKNGNPHVVYLSRQALAILEGLAALCPGGNPEPRRFVIPAQWSTTQPISESTLNRALERVAAGMEHFTVHDLRRTAATLLSEDEYASDVIEKALNHTIRGVRGVYNRAQYREQRRTMLQDWADKVDDYVIEQKYRAGSVTPITYGSFQHLIDHG